MHCLVLLHEGGVTPWAVLPFNSRSDGKRMFGDSETNTSNPHVQVSMSLNEDRRTSLVGTPVIAKVIQVKPQAFCSAIFAMPNHVTPCHLCVMTTNVGSAMPWEESTCPACTHNATRQS